MKVGDIEEKKINNPFPTTKQNKGLFILEQKVYT